jgi:hypothetical protein
MRAGYLREVIALLERALQTEDTREASELVKQRPISWRWLRS